MKRRFPTLFAAVALSAAAVASRVEAAPFEASRVARDAKWVLHVDSEIAFQSKLWDIAQRGMNQTAHLRLAAGAEMLRDFTGIDIFTDLKDVTLYGTGANAFTPNSAVLVLHGRWDPASLIAVLQNARNYDVVDHGDHAVHRWTDEQDGKTKFGAFFGSDLILISEAQASITSALDVLDDSVNKGMRAEDGPARPEATGVMAFVTADGIDALKATGRARSPIFNRVKAGWISVVESEETLTLRANVDANSAQAARQVKNALVGLKSIASMALSDDASPAQQIVVASLDTATVALEPDATNVTIDWPIPLETIDRLAVELKAEHEGRLSKQSNATTEPTTDANP